MEYCPPNLIFHRTTFYVIVIALLFIRRTLGQATAKTFQHGAVAADRTPCSTVGTKILQRNGSAVDSYIASVICLGVYHPMSSGLGGGGVALVYSREKREFYSYDYYGSAPAAAEENMFENNPDSSASRYSKYLPSKNKTLERCHLDVIMMSRRHNNVQMTSFKCLVLVGLSL